MMRQGRSWSGRERNCCFLNTGTGRFANISATSGFDFPDDGRGLAVVDWDHDGDLDLWVSNRNAPQLRFLRNENVTRNRFLSLNLKGNGVTTNRDAIGARVKVFVTDANSSSSAQPRPRQLAATLRAGEGFLSQSSKWLHFGLGEAEAIQHVLVHWPGGAIEKFANVEANRRYRLSQGQGKPVQFPVRAELRKLRPSKQEIPRNSAQARIPLVTLLPLPAMSYDSFDGSTQLLPLGTGKPVLLNLWASWCQPCLAELKSFGEQEQRIRAAGIEVVALSVDGLGKDETKPEFAPQTLASLGFSFKSGRANEPLLDMLQSIHNHLIPMQKPLPLPTSFLIDAQGRLSMIYKGAVSVDQVLADVAHSQRRRTERFIASTPLQGRTIEHEIVQRVSLREEARVYYNLGLLYSKKKNPKLAQTCYDAALQQKPYFVEALLNLGNLYLLRSEPVQAEKHYRRALQINPKFTKAHDNLGMALTLQGKTSEARTQFELALEIDSEFLAAHYHLGVLHSKLGDYERAVEQYEHVLRIDPAHNQARRQIDRLRAMIDKR